jgi:hypothetical protein
LAAVRCHRINKTTVARLRQSWFASQGTATSDRSPENNVKPQDIHMIISKEEIALAG